MSIQAPGSWEEVWLSLGLVLEAGDRVEVKVRGRGAVE